MDVVRQFSLSANSNVSLVLSARSAIHDVLADRLFTILGQDSVPEYSTDRLTDDDIQWLSRFFDQYGLWGDKASWSNQGKRRYLSTQCHSQLNSILIRLFESPQMASRFNRILERLNNKREYYEVLLSIMILAVIQHPPTLNLLADIWDDLIRRSQFKNNEAIREIFDFQAGEVKLRSATAARFVLNGVADGNLIVNTLATMARKCDSFANISDTHHDILLALMRYSMVQSLLPERQKRQAAIRYYEQIKNLPHCRTNPQFWLQYAIACLTLEELDRAEKYFETAYSYASSRGGNTLYIDNHFARFLLVRAVDLGNLDTCMTSFRKARRIIERQIKDNRMHYPFRVAKSYYTFFEAFEAKLSMKHQEEIVRAATFVSQRIESLPPVRQSNRDVESCYYDMQRIIERKLGSGATR